ncbi:helix-turn-helix domain-containing protein [Streptacidiphilus rugosus]|uniref:hypothetical protein n=1 Tax=Streptacidiphilus rugosus TaxID=405783 RepID=UPI0012FC9A79|nr:hypothetical protein [Streptacidiphilus rugosus]
MAEKLAAKANREGHLAYARERLAAELTVSLSTVRNHTRILRELGLLVWVEHGTRRNVLRTKNPGSRPTSYTATATIFATVAPPYWDHAMGRTTAGHGYTARLVSVDDLGRAYETALAQLARNPVPGATRRCPPSVTGFSRTQNFGQKGGDNYTRTRGANSFSRHHQHTNTPHVTPTQLAGLIAAAEQIKTSVHWLAAVCARRLAFQLRERLLQATTLAPLISELRSMAVNQLIRRPLAFLATCLSHPAAPEQRFDTPVAWAPVLPARPAPVELPVFDGQPEFTGPNFDGEIELLERWDAYCAQRAFAEALERWRDLEHQREIYHDLVPVYPVVEIAVDDTGERWAAMVEHRRRTHAAAFSRSAALRAQLRAQWVAPQSGGGITERPLTTVALPQ